MQRLKQGHIHLYSSLILMALSVGLSHSAHADSTAELEAGANVVVSALNTSGISEDDILRKIVINLRQKTGICKTTTFLRETAVPLCLIGDGTQLYQGKLGAILRYAVSKGKIDTVEGAILARSATRLSAVMKKDQVVLVNESPLDPPSGDGIAMPPLLAYRKNKENFAALRKAKNNEPVLPKDLLDQMSKAFPREMKGVGAINAEQYFAAQIGRLDLNRLAGLMLTATDFLVRPEARIVFYPANYQMDSDRLRSIERQEMELARAILAEEDDAQRETLKSQVLDLEAQASRLREVSPVDELMRQRAVKSAQIHDEVIALSQSDFSDITSIGRARLKDQFEQRVQQLNEIDEKLGQQIRTQQISPEDVQRFAFNSLKSDFATLKQEAPFSDASFVYSDALLAAWVAGDISSEAMRIMSTYPALAETNTSVWQKALNVSWTVGKGALMYFPSTSYIAIAISIFEETRKSTKESQEKKSNETHLVPLN